MLCFPLPAANSHAICQESKTETQHETLQEDACSKDQERGEICSPS